MRIGLFKNTCAQNGTAIMDAFAEGVKNSGDEIIYLSNLDEVDAAVIWSVHWGKPERKEIYNFYIKQKIPVIILEVGALIRNKSWRIGINNINLLGKFNNNNSLGNRWKIFNITLSKWNVSGSKIYICGQNENSGIWDTVNTEYWVKGLIRGIRCYSDKPIIFRPHPRYPIKFKQKLDCSIETPIYTDGYDNYNFNDILKDAYLVCNYSSNPGIEAVINGINVYTGDKSLAWPMSINNFSKINNLPCPDREQWAYDLSYTEWFIEEIREGIPYKRLRELL